MDPKLCAYCKQPIEAYSPADLHVECAGKFWEALCAEIKQWPELAEDEAVQTVVFPHVW